MEQVTNNENVIEEVARLSVEATEAIEGALEYAELRRSDVAKLVGVPRSRVSKVLDGETNMTIKTLAHFGLACGVRWKLVGVKHDDPMAVVVGSQHTFFERRSIVDATSVMWRTTVWLPVDVQPTPEIRFSTCQLADRDCLAA